MVDKQILNIQKLCEHWASHNDKHIEGFKKWRDVAEQKGLKEIVSDLSKAIDMMNECTKYLLSARDKLKRISNK
ncbi:MAG: hypothetical protein ACTSW3_06665 [Promethearchaeota archaeon]